MAQLPPDRVDSVAYRYAARSYELVREGAFWFVESGGARAPANKQAIEFMLQTLAPLIASGFPSAAEAAAVDFDGGSGEISVSLLGEEGAALVMSFAEKDEASYYVRTAPDQVYVVQTRFVDELLRKMEDFLATAGEGGGA